MNPNITFDIIKNNPGKQWYWKGILRNNFSEPFFFTDVYRKSESKKRLNIYRDELIQKVCTPKRMFNWNEDICIDFFRSVSFRI